MYSSMSPFSKTTLDINKLYVSSPISSKIPDEGEGKTDKSDESSPCKQGEIILQMTVITKILVVNTSTRKKKINLDINFDNTA